MRHEKAKIIAIWGSPHSGKTTFATKLATAIYDNYQATVIVLYTVFVRAKTNLPIPAMEKPKPKNSIGRSECLPIM